MAKRRTLTLDDLAQEADLYANPATEKQASILQAAERLFGEHGFDDTPTARIASEAGVTERTLFKYFPNKEALLKRVLFPALLKFVLPTQIRHVRNLIRTSSGDPRKLFDALFKDRLEFARSHHHQLRFMFRQLAKDDALRDQIAELWVSELFETGVGAMKEMQKNGAIRNDIDPRIAARVIVTTIISYILTRFILMPRAKWDDDSQSEQMRTILLEGLTPR